MSVGKVIRRAWSRRGPTGRKVKVVSYGFTVQIDGKQTKRFNAEWTEDTARDELAKYVLDREKPKAKPTTFAEAAKRYEDAKARKRSLREDKKTLKRLLAYFGGDTKLDRITADVIGRYRDERFAAGSKNRKDKDGKPLPLSPAAVNRELALLRHLLRLAHEEWNALAVVPKIRLEKEKQGRLRWLTPEEANTLLAKCRERKKDLADLVEFCVFTGLRQSEALGPNVGACRPLPWRHPARSYEVGPPAGGAARRRSRCGADAPWAAGFGTRVRHFVLVRLPCVLGGCRRGGPARRLSLPRSAAHVRVVGRATRRHAARVEGPTGP